MFSSELIASDSKLILIPQYFGGIVYDRNTLKYIPFDIESAKLLTRLKSEPVEKVIAETADPVHKKQILGFFEHFYQLGFFTAGHRFAGMILKTTPSPHILVGPLTLHLELIDSCNLKCKRCFAGKLPRHENLLTLNELDRLFACMGSMGTFRLGLTGGGPLLRRDLFEIIDLAIDHGLSPCLTTNGLLITEEIARKLGKRKLAWLNISMEGASPQTHDYIRGKGTFKKVMNRLSILSKYSRFSLAFTFMRRNMSEVEACVELAYRVSAEAAVFRPLYPIGTACYHPELMPSFTEYMKALDALSELGRYRLYEFCNVHPWGNEPPDKTGVTSTALVIFRYYLCAVSLQMVMVCIQ